MAGPSERKLMDLGGLEVGERPAEPTLEPGLERAEDSIVSDRLVTDVGGTIGVRVLSTPGMIAVMERCSSIRGRKLRFEVEVTEGERTIGVGTPERRVIDVGGVNSGG